MLKKLSFGQNKRYQNGLFFLSRAPIHNSFTKELYLVLLLIRHLYELKHNAHLSKSVCGIFHFRFYFRLLKFIILFNKKHELFDFKTS